MPRDFESEVLALMTRFLECDSYEAFHELITEFDQLYIFNPSNGSLSKETEYFCDDFNDKITVTGWEGDLTLDEFKVWLDGALRRYPKLPAT